MVSNNIECNNFAKNIWNFSLWILFFVDIATKYTHVYGGDLYRISLLVRGIFEVFLFIHIIICRKLIINNLFFYIIILVILFLISRLSYMISNDDYDIRENIIQLNKYIFLFLCFFSLKNFGKIEILKLLRTAQILYIGNAILIIFGAIFNVQLFESYYDKPYRFGYSGGILETNAATYVIILSIGTFYYHWLNKEKYKYGFFLIFFSSLLTGIKGVYGFIILLVFYHLYRSNLKLKVKSAIILLFAIILFSPILIEFFQDNSHLFDFFIKTSSQNGLFYMLLSGRHTYLLTRGLELLNSWKTLNFLGGYQDVNYLIEMELFDLFLFFGVLGSLIYLILFLKIFIIKKARFWNFLLISIFGVAFLGGHFFMKKHQ